MRILVVRIGAYGDALIVTPLLRYLKQQGDEIYFLGSEQAQEILEHNPNVDKFIFHKRDSVKVEDLGDYFKRIQKENECDKIIDMCESIEVSLALSPDYPQWNWPKWERFEKFNRNYYEYAFIHAGLCKKNEDGFSLKEPAKPCFESCPPNDLFLPEMFFTEAENLWAIEQRKELLGSQVLMWGLSGSGRQKTYPYVPYIVGDLMQGHKELKVVLVGGQTCQILESGFPKHKRILKKSGEWTFRQSALMAKFADLVVAPDTGFLHAAGCWETPKIGLLTHTTIENITKHFKNDFSIESEAPCAPCFRLVGDCETQCPIEKESKACICMSEKYMKPEIILNRIEEVLCRSMV